MLLENPTIIFMLARVVFSNASLNASTLVTEKDVVIQMRRRLNTSEKRISSLERVIQDIVTNITFWSDVVQNYEGHVDLHPEKKVRAFFSAYKNHSESGLNMYRIIKFEETLTNIGNHYHPEDGIFIAPVSGVYLFTWTINTESYAHTQMLVGGNIVSTTTTANVGAANSGSNTVIVSVKKGVHVWIQTCYTTGNWIYGAKLSSHFHSTFSGHLLYQFPS